MPASTPELQTPDELRIEIANLKAQLAANESRGERALVPDGEGVSRPVSSLRDQMDELTQELLLSAAQTKRLNDEYESRQPIPRVNDGKLEYVTPNYSNPPLLTRAEAIKLHGFAKWNGLSNAAKVQAMDVRQSDIDKLSTADIFGPSSSSAKAVRLMKDNPTAYKILKARAVEEGLF
jgi:hypothetical protein